MRRRWSERAIRRAIHILDICAGTRDLCGARALREHGFDNVGQANVLAGEAFDAAPLHGSWSATYAEAAGMLRAGWLPGDPVVLRRRHA